MVYKEQKTMQEKMAYLRSLKGIDKKYKTKHHKEYIEGIKERLTEVKEAKNIISQEKQLKQSQKSPRRVLVEAAYKRLAERSDKIAGKFERKGERYVSKKFLMHKQSLRRLKNTGAGIMPRRALPIHYEPIVKDLGGRPRKTTNKISSDILNQDYVFGGRQL